MASGTGSHFGNLKRAGALGTAAGLLACVGCCALPMLVAAGVGGSGLVWASGLVQPGADLLIGVGTFLLVAGATALWTRRKGTVSCGDQCALDGQCCDRGAHIDSRQDLAS
ncbi:MAG: hypothetical protein OXU20_26500 [Myxococcales bacterium]|nr:hypothetical protein [Myxococcales bacterium]